MQVALSPHRGNSTKAQTQFSIGKYSKNDKVITVTSRGHLITNNGLHANRSQEVNKKRHSHLSREVTPKYAESLHLVSVTENDMEPDSPLHTQLLKYG